jgi:MFS family permease
MHIFWMMTVWVFFQAAVAFPAGKLRESGKLPARWAMMCGAVGTLLGYLSLAFAPHVVFAYIGFSMFSGMGAGMVYATCVNMVGKWYPERKGGKTGFVNGGFAYGSVPFVFLFNGYMDLTNFRWVLVSVGVFLAGWSRVPATSSRTRRRTGGPPRSTRSTRPRTRARPAPCA